MSRSSFPSPEELLTEIAALRAQVADLKRQTAERRRAEAAVASLENPYRLIVETAGDAVIVIDEDSTILIVNPAAEEMFGYEPGALVGQSLTALMPEALRPVHRAGVRGYLASGTRNLAWSGAELPALHRSGRRFRVEISLGEAAINGKRHFVGALRDVTERRRVHEVTRALAEVARHLSEALEPSVAAGRMMQAVNQLFQARRAVLYELDAAAGELVCLATYGAGDPSRWIGRRLARGAGGAGRAVAENRPVWSTDPEADSEIEPPEWTRARLREEEQRGILAVPLRARDEMLGALVLGFAPGRVMADEELALLLVFGEQAALALHNARLYADSERRRRAAERLGQAVRALAHAQGLQQAAERVTAGAVDLLDARAAVVFVPDRSADEVRSLAFATRGPGGRSETAAPDAGELARLVLRVRRLVAGPDARHGAAGEVAAEGRTGPGPSDRALLGVPLLVSDRVVGVLCVSDRADRVFDVEARQLAQAFADPAALALDNGALTDELRSALERQRVSQRSVVEIERLRATTDLASGVAHHLSNLLTLILARTQLLLPHVAAADVRQGLERVEKAAQDGAEVIRRLNAFAEVQALAVTVPVDLNQVVRDAVAAMQPRWDDEARLRDVRVEVVLDPGMLPPVPGEPMSLRDVVVSLLQNATEALTESGRITVTTWVSAGSVACSVADTGPGMPEEVRRRAFEPFFTTKGAQSLGLGLSLAYGILRRHGGDLEIAAGETGGAVVTLRLPRADAVAPPLSRAG